MIRGTARPPSRPSPRSNEDAGHPRCGIRPGASGDDGEASTTANGASQIELWWKVATCDAVNFFTTSELPDSDLPALGCDVADRFLAPKHQCLLVELDGFGEYTFLRKSHWRNMDFVKTASIQQAADLLIKKRHCSGRDIHRIVRRTFPRPMKGSVHRPNIFKYLPDVPEACSVLRFNMNQSTIQLGGVTRASTPIATRAGSWLEGGAMAFSDVQGSQEC